MERKKLKDLEGGGEGGGGGGSSSVEQHHKELLSETPEDIPKHTSERCIYRIPNRLRKVTKGAYTPHVISIGPLHHGKPEFADMEKKKIIYMREFRKRIKITPDEWDELESYVRRNTQSIYNCYDEIPNFKSDDDFATMVLLDGVFIIEYLSLRFDSDWSDHEIRTSWKRVAIESDLLLLENQLPYYILERLYGLAFGIPDGGENPFLTLCCDCFTGSISISTCNIPERVEIKHFTDLIRHNLVKPSLNEISDEFVRSLPSAIKLHESGIKFKAIKDESKTLLDLQVKKRDQLVPFFKLTELHMPCFSIDDETERFFRNIMALEQCHYPSETHICNYIILLDELINTERDVDVLIENGILTNRIGDNTKAAEMVNKLGLSIVNSESYLFHVAEDLKKHYNNNWNQALAKLVNVYFCNPWRSTATVAAIILLLLTLVQTICSVVSLF